MRTCGDDQVSADGRKKSPETWNRFLGADTHQHGCQQSDAGSRQYVVAPFARRDAASYRNEWQRSSAEDCSVGEEAAEQQLPGTRLRRSECNLSAKKIRTESIRY